VNSRTYSVVDLFAGPGGLGEGFSAYRDGKAFQIAASIEMDASASRTLRFRAFTRLVRREGIPLDFSALVPSARDAEERFLKREKARLPEAETPRLDVLWAAAGQEALRAELGGEDPQNVIGAALDRVQSPSVLIGGPPCQAYSLVGRVRNQAISGYTLGADARHRLYEHYIDVIQQLKPVAFVMENVKGILSAKTRKAGVFGRIVEDLRSACGEPPYGGYVLCPLAPRRPPALGPKFVEESSDPYDFVIRAEDYGVPQARHRVIVVGLRRDVAESFLDRTGESVGTALCREFGSKSPTVPVGTVLAGLPPLLSLVSQRNRSGRTWGEYVTQWALRLAELDAAALGLPDETSRRKFVRELERVRTLIDAGGHPPLESESDESPEVLDWLTAHWSAPVLNHEARGHMSGDLGRYLFASTFGRVTGVSPKAPDFPDILAPDHKNWSSGKFADRFRVQVQGRPATTVTCHIAKDGNYFIHPDPAQCRSLTVREAARIQTFPDDYIFLGNRTQQYVQVGNAVPPFLAERVAGALHSVLSRASAGGGAKVRWSRPSQNGDGTPTPNER